MQEEKWIIERIQRHFPELKEKQYHFKSLSSFGNLAYAIVVQQQPLYVFKKHLYQTNRDIQNKLLFACYQAGVGPKSYYCDQSYSLLHYIRNARCPDGDQLTLQPLFTKMMCKLCKFHSLKIQQFKKEKHQVYSRYIFSEESLKMIISANNKSNNPNFIKLYEQIIMSKRQFYSSKMLPATDESVKLCHHDLYNFNILINQEQLYIIDYEYSRHDFVAFDLATFLNQTRFDYDKKQYPGFQFSKPFTVDQIYKFVYRYPGYYPELEKQVLRFLCVVNLHWAIESLLKFDVYKMQAFDSFEHGIKKMKLFELYWIMNVEAKTIH